MAEFTLYNGDCLQVMRGMDADSVDTIITDPPYGLSFMGKEWDHGVPGVPFWQAALHVAKPGAMLFAFGGTRTQHRLTVAIEDAGWEIRDVIMWVYAQGFPKSHNISKQLQKNDCSCKMGVGRAQPYTHKGGHDDKEETQPTTKHSVRFVRESDVSQAQSARKKQRQVLQSGVSEQGTQGDGAKPGKREQGQKESSVERRGYLFQKEGELQEHSLPESAGMGKADGASGWVHNGTSANHGPNGWKVVSKNRSSASHRPQPSEQRSGKSGIVADQFEPQESGMGEGCDRCGQRLDAAKLWDGWGTALKPAWEPIIVAMKPTDGTFADNAQKWGVAGLWIDGGRVDAGGESLARPFGYGGIGSKQLNAIPHGKITGENLTGRFPANLIHDGSAEVTALFPETMADDGNVSAARFFYCAKAGKEERNAGLAGMPERVGGSMQANTGETMGLGGASLNGKPKQIQPAQNHHPTVKPLSLMDYLCTLTKTPTGGVVLDPFMGSGSTGAACMRTGRNFKGIDLNPEYVAIAEARIKHWAALSSAEWTAQPIQVTPQPGGFSDLPLFAEATP